MGSMRNIYALLFNLSSFIVGGARWLKSEGGLLKCCGDNKKLINKNGNVEIHPKYCAGC